MTWRRFLTLLSGLSFDSRWVFGLRADARRAPSRRITNAKAAERYFASIN